MQRQLEEAGWDKVFHGDSRAVRFRLDERQQGETVLQAWYLAVPQMADVLRGGNTTPAGLEKELRKVHYVGVLTAKELHVHLSYGHPGVADTTQYVPVGEGAMAGANFVLRGGASAWGKATASEQQGALKAIRACRDEALLKIQGFQDACSTYQAAAPHRADPHRNCRVARDHLLDLADIEVMLCFYKNYRKLMESVGDAPVPPNAGIRGWVRRSPLRQRG